MRQHSLFVAALAASLAVGGAVAAPRQGSIAAAIASPARTPANVARDAYRHPAGTLAFFGIRPTDTVVEIWPGGGWYTEILAPYLAPRGRYLAAALWPKQLDPIRAMQTRDAARYGKVELAAFPAFADTPADAPRVAPGTADVVLTFRNVHNWRMGYQRGGKDYAADAFAQMFAMLKPGGTLGVVDHRLPESASIERETNSGYIKVSTIRALAQAAGFRFVGASEVNANPRDTADWPKGVWTLPPSYTLKDVDRAKYAAIGESDRMTLKFVRPKR